MTKPPTPAEMLKGESDSTNNATKKIDYTAIADRLWTVSWSKYGHPSSFSMNIEKGVLIPQVIEALYISQIASGSWANVGP